MRILVSACLLGVYCRYNGQAKSNSRIMALNERHVLIPFCPEIYGGLPTPREPSEIRDACVYTQSGIDVTSQYRIGGKETARIARLLGCECAILQDRSPACGVGIIHNGKFDGGLVSGDGIATEELRKANIAVYAASDDRIDTF